MLFVRAYPREAQEMVFDSHEKGFALFKGVARRGIYDNMKMAVDAVFVSKERAFNRRFAQLMSHHFIEPTACTPATGWQKGQVENHVGVVRSSPRHSFRLASGKYALDIVRKQPDKTCDRPAPHREVRHE